MQLLFIKKIKYAAIFVIALLSYLVGPINQTHAFYPASALGNTYMMHNGAKYYLRDVHIVKTGQGATSEAYYNTGGSGGSSGGYYRLDNFTPTNIGERHTWGSCGMDCDANDAWWCGNPLAHTGDWCGLNCGSNPNKWRAYFPSGYNTANFPGGVNYLSGHWVLHPPAGLTISGEDSGDTGVDGGTITTGGFEWFYLNTPNDYTSTGWDFEWAPDAVPTATPTPTSQPTPTAPPPATGTSRVSCSLTATLGGTTLTGPTTISVGQSIGLSATYNVDNYSVYSGTLYGGIAAEPTTPAHTNITSPVTGGSVTEYPQTISTFIAGNSTTLRTANGSLTTTWTPTTAGTYDVMCNGMKSNNSPTASGIECRGSSQYLTADPGNAGIGVTYCGNGASIRVTVTRPALGPLIIYSGSDGVASGSYGNSGLRTLQSGSNYYNSLDIKQRAASGTTPSQVKLIGMAFTQRNPSPAITTLSGLKASAEAGNGIVLVRAGPACGSSCTVAGKTFTSGNHYAYMKRNGSWVWEVLNDQTPKGTQTDGIDAKILGFGTNPLLPEFNIHLFNELGSRTWGTFGYLMDSTGSETIESKTPTAF